MDNMQHWKNLCEVPRDALKEIGFGKLKGKSDINPQWRYEAMTKEFGVCGIGWKYEIAKTWTQPVNDEVLLFVEVHLYIKDGEHWSAPIPAVGGDFVLEKDKNGLHGNDEAYKMATTDALGAAMKMLGVAADVYRGLANDSKYGREKTEQKQQPTSFGQAQQQIAKEKAQEREQANLITELQLKKLFAMSKENGLTSDDMRNLLHWKYSVQSSKELTKQQASESIEKLPDLWSEFVAEQSKVG